MGGRVCDHLQKELCLPSALNVHSDYMLVTKPGRTPGCSVLQMPIDFTPRLRLCVGPRGPAPQTPVQNFPNTGALLPWLLDPSVSGTGRQPEQAVSSHKVWGFHLCQAEEGRLENTPDPPALGREAFFACF